MTEASKTNADTTVAKPVAAKQSGKKTEVTEAVVVYTKSFDVSQPVLIDAARETFLAMVKESYGDVAVDDVRFIKVNHHVGKSATYHFAATIGG
jgi:hypothetical protein